MNNRSTRAAKQITSNTQLATIALVMVSMLIFINVLPRTHFEEPCNDMVKNAVGMKITEYGFPFTFITKSVVDANSNSNVCTYPEFDGATDVNTPMLIADLLIAIGAMYIGLKFGYKLAEKERAKK